MTLNEISINILYVFFDWLLSIRKDRLSTASILQTLKKETGCLEIDPLIKSQMHGV